MTTENDPSKKETPADKPATSAEANAPETAKPAGSAEAKVTETGKSDSPPSSASDKLSDAANSAKEMAGKVFGKAKGLADEAIKTAKSHATKENLNNTAKSASDLASKVFAKAKDAAADVKKELGNVNDIRKETFANAEAGTSKKEMAKGFWAKLSGKQKGILAGILAIFVYFSYSVLFQKQETQVASESSPPKAQSQNTPRSKGVEEARKALVSKVAACGWRAAPESGGFFLGMTIPDAQTYARQEGYKLECRESKPITGGSVTETVQNMLNDEFSVGDSRASNLCETKIDGNRISLFFFRPTSSSEPLLAKAYNRLDKFVKNYPADTYYAAVPVMEALSEKFGFDVSKGGKSCSIDSGQGYQSVFKASFSRPFPDRTRDQPNMSLFFTVYDEKLINIGGAVTKVRDESVEKNHREKERNELRGNAPKL